MPADAPPSRSAGIVVLATIAVIASLYLARDFLVPIGLAILFTGLLRPVVRRFERARLPAPIGATVVLVVFVGLLAVGGLALADPLRAWVSDAPATLAAAQRRLESLRRPLQTISTTAQKMEDAALPAAGVPGIAARVFGTTTALLGGLVEVVLLTFLLLASGDTFLAKLVKVLPVRREKREAVRIAHEVESVVSHYMTVTALINLGQGALVGLAM